MNLDTCTPGQRQIITTLNKPLMVSAGAGSGKTFTLTQRIAYALSEDTPDAQPVQSISPDHGNYLYQEGRSGIEVAY